MQYLKLMCYRSAAPFRNSGRDVRKIIIFIINIKIIIINIRIHSSEDITVPGSVVRHIWGRPAWAPGREASAEWQKYFYMRSIRTCYVKQYVCLFSKDIFDKKHII